MTILYFGVLVNTYRKYIPKKIKSKSRQPKTPFRGLMASVFICPTLLGATTIVRVIVAR